MKYKIMLLNYIMVVAVLTACNPQKSDNTSTESSTISDTTTVTKKPEPEKPKPLTADDIKIDQDYTFEKYIIEDEYTYRDKKRTIKWDVIREKLAIVEKLQEYEGQWCVFQNYRNRNGEAPTITGYVRNDYGRVSDTLGVERFQSVPLYDVMDSVKLVRYGRDGWIAKVREQAGSFLRVSPIMTQGEYLIPPKYVSILPDSASFKKVVIVDRTDQNIITLEQQSRGKWRALSTNPCTTGVHRPPHAHETPLGIFIIQKKKVKMWYHKDGTTDIGGYAPYASRFTCGAYIHGVPVNKPRTKMIEYSQSLGTVPRSHMCVRNATSHAKFVFEWAPVYQALVIII